MGDASVRGTPPEPRRPRVMRGDSFLRHDSSCHRYRVAARSSNTAASATANIGFRRANDAVKGIP
ncbi:SUMF1/EgtB/PvdO family nonheme iron enzyme [Thermomonospora umbrina]|uniref:SUMF1/EgtB/PvdO family nonheme iron enzyme n=1 Tax=Thermomonospora umbrina TaxID=111806 RepID=UPI000E24A7FC|nr:SUMF1/EgtB/PvdO family nonheme iron enzyme [Thermomonospora umbrina]